MPSLLLEIGCEELPAAACYEAERQLPRLCLEQFGREPARLLIGPRRLASLVRDLPEQTEPEWIKGPPEAMRERAAAGFARRHGVDPDELEVRDGFLGIELPGRPLREVLQERIDAVVRGLTFGKTMRWDDSGLRYPRPVRWVFAKLDAETIAGHHTFGHRFTAGAVEIPSAEDYPELLRAAGVEPDAAERRRLILEGLPEGWSDPAGVLDEVVHLVEWPTVLESAFDERFLDLPRDVVVAAMQSHQRYFPLEGNRFALVANGGDPDVVRAGNTQVLENRLDDAVFSFERDVKVGLDGLAAKLGAISFFEGGGTLADKADRLAKLVERLGGGEATLEASRLAKADQASELVREFPELEGRIGAEYARLVGYPEAVCAAIEEHYLPDSAGGPLPSTESGRVLSAADRIDTLAVSFSLGHRPTGSRDPFGLRRAAIGLCRLATEGGLAVSRALLEGEVADFVEERYEGLLDVPVEFVRAARRSRVTELGQVAELAKALARLEDDALDRLHTAYSRAERLAGKAEGVAPELNADLLVEESEIELAREVARLTPEIQTALQRGDTEGALRSAAELGAPVDRFFEEVLVMAEDSAVRANRLRLLLDVRDAIGHVGDLAQIPR
ncbi:MAG: glycine--tRNA ligase subunit beta [Actinobacteria bacterium]|nr:glycine--tRNA ligase subunit beta [Actinomycetota bacterium]